MGQATANKSEEQQESCQAPPSFRVNPVHFLRGWLLAWVLLCSDPAFAQQLDDSWQVRVAGRSVRVRSDGSFEIPYVESNSSDSPSDGPEQTLPQYSRLIGFKPDGNQLRYVYSAPFEIRAGARIELRTSDLTFSDQLPFVATTLSLSAERTRLDRPEESTQLRLLAKYLNGNETDVTQEATRTFFESSNPQVATVTPEGQVTAQHPGIATILAQHEGLSASLQIEVGNRAQTNTLIGFAYGPDHRPLAEAIVRIPGTNFVALSNPEGRFVIEALPKSITVSKVTILSAAGAPHFGSTDVLPARDDVIDAGILVGYSIDQILNLPCNDPDGDCLPDDVEQALGLDPTRPDSDGDGIPDGLEDSDGDTLANQLELFIGTSASAVDSDSDGFSDQDEVLRYSTLASLADSDGNGILDGEQDQDNDGLLDVLEDLNGNQRIEEGETDPLRADSDRDGVLDTEELTEGTSPINEYHFEPRRLAYFSFDTPQYLGDAGQTPLVNQGNSQSLSFSTTARNAFLSTNGTRLVLPATEPNNRINLNPLRGTVKFWFRPNWNSGEVGHPFGSRLIEIGTFSITGGDNKGWWSLFLNSDRTTLTFASQAPNRTSWRRYVDATNLNFEAGKWYEIELVYGPRVTYPFGWKDPDQEQLYPNSFIYINGERVGFGQGVWPELLPSQEALDQGFAIGSQLDGTLTSDAVFDEIQTFNYPLYIGNNRQLTDRNWQAVANLNNNTITLERRFPRRPTLPFPVDIFRKEVGALSWGKPIATDYPGVVFIDRNVQPGRAYEYRIWDDEALDFDERTPLVLRQYLTAAIDLPPVHDRGKVIMMIENSIANPLQEEITQFKSDLVGDGWEVASLLVSRQNDDNLELNKNAVAITKSLIDLEIEANRTNVVVLLGHVPIPMSGLSTADGHDNRPGNGPDHRGAWTADGFYGATNRTHFTDVSPRSIENLDHPQNSNFPGDGKFDQNELPQPFGIAVGRIDFARMEAFTEAPFLPGYPNLDKQGVELELLRQYLKKNHRYRHGELTFSPRMSTFRGYPFNRDAEEGLYNANNLAAAVFGLERGRNIQVRSPATRLSWTLSFYEANGSPIGTIIGYEHQNVANAYSYTSWDFLNPRNWVNSAFFLSYGSYFGDWNLNQDNWLKSLLATPNAGLAALYHFPNKWRLEKLGLGAPIAVGMQEFNDTSKYTKLSVSPNGNVFSFHSPIFAPPRMLSILGDPTLRVHVLPPPSAPQVTGSGRQFTLTWRPPPGTGYSYHVYRSVNGIEGPFQPLTLIAAATEPGFTDFFAPSGPKTYAIRAAKRQRSGSGSYINLSQAIFISTE